MGRSPYRRKISTGRGSAQHRQRRDNSLSSTQMEIDHILPSTETEAEKAANAAAKPPTPACKKT